MSHPARSVPVVVIHSTGDLISDYDLDPGDLFLYRVLSVIIPLAVSGMSYAFSLLPWRTIMINPQFQTSLHQSVFNIDS